MGILTWAISGFLIRCFIGALLPVELLEDWIPFSKSIYQNLNNLSEAKFYFDHQKPLYSNELLLQVTPRVQNYLQ